MGRLLSSLLILGLIVSGCAPRGNNSPASVRDTWAPPEGQIRQVGDYEVIEGATKNDGLEVKFDKGTKSMSLTGPMTLKTYDTKKTIQLELNLAGTSDDKGYAVLKPVGSTGVVDLVVAAKATCLGVESDCSSNFVDIYVSYEDRIYHHQIEALEDTLAMPMEPKEADAANIDEDTTETGGQSQSDESGDDDHEDEHDEVLDMDETEGSYVGNVEKDLENILEVKPKPKAGTPNKEEPKKDQPKKEDPKKEVPAKPEKKPEVPPKKETPVKPEVPPKKEEPKKDIPKKDEPKKDVPKKDEPKKEEPKKEEPKKETPKVDDKDDDKDETPVVSAPPKFDMLSKLDQAVGPTGTVRLKNGTVVSGSLEHATDILSYQKAYPDTNFRVLRPDRKTYYGTIELAYLIAKMGKFTQAVVPSHTLRLGDLAKKKGGPLGSHKSHRNGLDADIAYYFKADKAMTGFSTALKGNKPIGDWMMAQQWKLFKYTVSSKFVDRIFIHPALKKSLCSYAQNQGEIGTDLAKETLRRLIPEVNHYNHFHLRIKCAKSQERCFQMAEPKAGTGC
ncbi:penicillin-insensitive murein endopeptidase [Bdellovibrio sp. HCB185ZH]|uniref:penicillin-insensitive murein endopeptidase n=1 Tax=Bdellovibrio sp. HCB185ZH TaxID=3394235 RepID=UPI0039A43471